jgi:hypothetical protein
MSFRAFVFNLFLAVALCFLLAASPVFAQSVTATLSGVVKDEQGAVVPGVKVTVTDPATRLERSATTDEGGQFVVPQLPPSAYSVKLEREGFATAQIQDVVLNANDRRSLNIEIKVGGASETVTVEAAAAEVNPAVSTVVDRKFVENMPLNGRTIQSLLTLTPGVVVAGGDGQLSVNGQRTNANYLTIDGVSGNIGVARTQANTTSSFQVGFGGTAGDGDQNASGSTPGYNSFGGTNGLISTDALQEVKVQTSTYSAQYGRQPGGQIQLTSRSGTNEFHGTVFLYHRNDRFDARDWFANALNAPKQALRQNDFGFVAGGPVYFPRFGEGGSPFYKGKDRTFFFVSYEGLRLKLPQTAGVFAVPSTALRNLAALPASVKAILNARPLPTDESAGCRLRQFATIMGQANFQVASCYVAAPSNETTMDAFSVRLDHNFNKKHSIFGRYNIAPSESVTFLVANRTRSRSTPKTLTVGWRGAFGKNFFNELTVNRSTNSGDGISELYSLNGSVPYDPARLLPPGAPESARIMFNLGPAFGATSDNIGPTIENRQEQFNIVDNLTWTRGSHTFVFGFDYRRLTPTYAPREYEVRYALNTANYTNFLSANPVVGAVQIFSSDRVKILYNNFSAFAQDTWRVNRRLALDAGLRWEVNPAPKGLNTPLYTLTGFPNISALALAPAGTPFYPTRWNSLAPRFGVTYLLRQKQGWETVLRGGAGIYYDLGSGVVGAAAYQFPYARSVTRSNVPFPAQAASLAPAAPLNLNPPFTNQNFTVVDPDYALPRTYQWSFGVSQSLGASNALTVTYVGNAGRRLLRRYLLGIRATPPPAGGTIPVNPNFGNSRINITRNDPDFADSSDYHSLQAQYLRRLTGGLQVLTNYTLSKAVDTGSSDNFVYTLAGFNTSPGLYRAASDFDRRHVFNAAVTYELPSLKPVGRFAKILNNIFLKGWATDYNFKYQSAAPLTVSYLYVDPVDQLNYNFTVDLVSGQEPWIADGNAPGGRRLNAAAFAPPQSAFSSLGNRSLVSNGNIPRNGIRGFDAAQLDFVLRRTFALTERVNLQFRAEVFNVLNRPNFAAPNSVLGVLSYANVGGVQTPSFSPAPQFGNVTSTLARSSSTGGVNGGLSPLYSLGGPRSMQFVLRLNF